MNDHALLNFLVDRLQVGVLVIDPQFKVVLWNQFMASHSGLPAQEVIGRQLFECFPGLPQKWLEKKIQSVFILKNYAFTSWEQRPFLFRFHHNRPVTGGVEAMQQDCTFLPIRDDAGDISHICICVYDVTDTAIFQKKLVRAIAQLDDEKAAQEELIVQLQKAQTALEELANCDGLTGLANRRQFDRVLKTEWARSTRELLPLSLLMIDVDHFKAYNDTYGHQMGDACLQYVAQALGDDSRLRASDVVARYGGEEFSVVLPNTDLDGALVVAERMRSAVCALDLKHSHSTAAAHVTISIGAACMQPNRLSNPAQLLRAADVALYMAKNEGRNRVIAEQVDPSTHAHLLAVK